MNDYIEMYSKKENEVVRVYNISATTSGSSLATIFVPSKFNNPQYNFMGWQTVKMTSLIPIDLKDAYIKGLPTSKTQKNKAKSRMTLVDAIWRTTDGNEFPHTMIDMAIEHELELMNKEKENIE